MTVAAVNLWGTRIGAVALEPGAGSAVFAYDPAFCESGIEVAPLQMPLRAEPYAFPELRVESFRGLPGLLADSLPDRYGNALIDAWLARQGRAPESFDAVERLCYVGRRGMGALEYAPARGPRTTRSSEIEIAALVELASEVLGRREEIGGSLAGDRRRAEALKDILLVGTSAGGARAKAVIAWNPETDEVRSGQVDAPSGFEHWLLKFDGVSGNRDKELEDPRGYGAIEVAYASMAREAAIEMSDCRLLEENGRRHFMTRRFDRVDGDKVHLQSLGALAHYDFNQAAANGYEQALEACARLGVGAGASEQLFRRMVFNIVARNQDDHVKNIAFLMDRRGRWSLAPAFDVTYAFQPGGRWTARHQMTVNGKADDFTRHDLRACAGVIPLPRGRADAILDEVCAVVRRWPAFAARAGVAADDIARIASTHRLALPA